MKRLGPFAVVIVLALAMFSLGAYVNRMQGTVAHDSATSAFPVVMGGKAASGLPSAVSAGDAVNAYFDTNGRQVVVLGSALQDSVDSITLGANASVTGLVTYRFATNGTNGLLTSTVQTPKASTGRLYAIEFRNTNANVMFVHFYDSSSVTVGSTSPIQTVAVPGGSGTAPGITRESWNIPVSFGTNIKMAATTSDDHTVSTAPGTGLSGVIYFK